MPINATHDGLDQMGAPTQHRGLLKNCGAPECQDRIAEQQHDLSVYCPHGKKIVEQDPEHTDHDGQPVGRIVDPWPCTVDGCTLEAFESDQQAEEDAYWDSINELISDQYR